MMMMMMMMMTILLVVVVIIDDEDDDDNDDDDDDDSSDDDNCALFPTHLYNVDCIEGTHVIGSRVVESILQLYPSALSRGLKAEFYGQVSRNPQ